jgi:uncharacterized membrane protein YciS (DUF1049 family)
MHVLSRAGWVVVALVLIAFALLAVNQEHAALRFLVWETPAVSVFWWLLLAFVTGVVVGSMLTGLMVLKGRFRERRLSRELARSKEEAARLKSSA